MKLNAFGLITCKVCDKLFVTNQELRDFSENHILSYNCQQFRGHATFSKTKSQNG